MAHRDLLVRLALPVLKGPKALREPRVLLERREMTVLLDLKEPRVNRVFQEMRDQLELREHPGKLERRDYRVSRENTGTMVLEEPRDLRVFKVCLEYELCMHIVFGVF